MRYAPIRAMNASQINCFPIFSWRIYLAESTHRMGCSCCKRTTTENDANDTNMSPEV